MGRYSSLKIDKDGMRTSLMSPMTASTPSNMHFWIIRSSAGFVMKVARGAEYSSLVLDFRPTTAYFLRGQPERNMGPGSLCALDGASWKIQGIPEVNPGAFGFYTSICWTKRITRPSLFTTTRVRRRVRYLAPNLYLEWRLLGGAHRGPGIWKRQVQFNRQRFHRNSASGICKRGYDARQPTVCALERPLVDAEVLEGAGKPTRYVRLHSLDTQNVPHIAYTDMVAQVVKYATRRSGRWVFLQWIRWRMPAFRIEMEWLWTAKELLTSAYYDSLTGVLKVAHLNNDSGLRKRWIKTSRALQAPFKSLTAPSG